MTKPLVGTDPDQTPLNGMLGTAAFTDADTLKAEAVAAVAPAVYVQATDPGIPPGTPAIWVQTNVGGDPTKFSLWFNT